MKSRRLKKIKHFCDVSERFAQLSVDPRIKCACTIFPIDCSAIYAIGYNGPARGMSHEVHAQLPGDGTSGCAHAEMNALLKFSPALAKPSILYTTFSPCIFCAPHIINTDKLHMVIYRRKYADLTGLALICKSDLKIVALEDLRKDKVLDSF